MSCQCPLCFALATDQLRNVHQAQRLYFHCSQCDLIFLDPNLLPPEAEEIERYKKHRNHLFDQGYREFLLKFIEPLLLKLQNTKAQLAIDYGCGPGPVLAILLKERSPTQFKRIDEYDPHFAKNKDLLKSQYDLVMATEVVEHFRQPKEEWTRILKLLDGGGRLAIMTQFHLGPQHFLNWWYPKDLTHFCFYSEKTLTNIQKLYSLEILWLRNPVAIFLKK